MCGLIGILRSGRHRLDPDRRAFAAARDRMSHRGPDDAGMWADDTAWIGHRRLAIMDPDHGGAPYVVDPGSGDRCVVAFNGELFNHRALRRTLESEGATFRTQCDGETAAVALAWWGTAALERFHGMFAVAWYRPGSRMLRLARDPFGVVPLYYREDPTGAAFASELRILRELAPHGSRPDPAVVSSYLSSIRVTLDDRTLIEGLRTVVPGECVGIDLSETVPRVDRDPWWTPPAPAPSLRGDDADEALRRAVTRSLEAHLQSDVEVCTLLSGGVDSAILTALARERVPNLRSFTAIGGDGDHDPDRAAARLMASHLGIPQTEIHVDRTSETSVDRWRRMVRLLGVPLGTPNEIAINALAEGVADAGIKVAVGGEGADELLGGYEPVLRIVELVAGSVSTSTEAAVALLGAMSWLAPAQKTAVLRPEWIDASESDRHLIAETARAIESGGRTSDPRSYLRWLQEINLTGLLQRLNHATMLASVEARPPFADRFLAEIVAGIDTRDLFQCPADAAATVQSKICLRRAFGDIVPEEIVRRPKASFPTPFQNWSRRMLQDDAVTAAIRPLILPGTLESILAPESPHGLLAWPLANLGVWCVETGITLDL